MKCRYFNVTYFPIILPNLITQFGGKRFLKGKKFVTIGGIPAMSHRLIHDLQQIAPNSGTQKHYKAWHLATLSKCLVNG